MQLTDSYILTTLRHLERLDNFSISCIRALPWNAGPIPACSTSRNLDFFYGYPIFFSLLRFEIHRPLRTFVHRRLSMLSFMLFPPHIYKGWSWKGNEITYHLDNHSTRLFWLFLQSESISSRLRITLVPLIHVELRCCHKRRYHYLCSLPLRHYKSYTQEIAVADYYEEVACATTSTPHPPLWESPPCFH